MDAMSSSSELLFRSSSAIAFCFLRVTSLGRCGEDAEVVNGGGWSVEGMW